MDAPSPATAPRMARRSIGETAADTVMMQVRWPGALLRRLDAIRGKRSRADVIREAVAEKLARETDGEQTVTTRVPR